MHVCAGGTFMDHQYIPILVGCGQVTQRQPDPTKALNALDLTAAAAREAAEDAHGGKALLEALDTVVVLRSFSDTSWRFKSPFGGPRNPIGRKPHRQRLGKAARLHPSWREHAAMVRESAVRNDHAWRS